MITLTPKSQKEIGELTEIYDISITQLVNMLVHKEYQERKMR